MFYQMGYKKTLTVVSKFRKPNLLPQWNRLFTLLFKAFSEWVTGLDCASKLFMAIIYGIYTWLNIDFGVVLWGHVIQSTHSTAHHREISFACFWTVTVQRAIDKLQISVMQDSLMANISTFHTTGIILAHNSKFSFVVSIPEAMLRDVPAASKFLEGYQTILASGFCPLTPEMQSIISKANKPNKGGQKGCKKGEKNKVLKSVRLNLLKLLRSERHKLDHLHQLLLQQRSER